jgi:FAD-dependent oxidoreductase domain-containing protein 1
MAKIAIIGGGVIGSSIAYHLALAGHAADVVMIEPDPTYEFAAMPRATGGIRQLFTVPRTSAWRSTGMRSTASSRR